LHHLIVRAAALLDVSIAEPDSYVIDQLSYLKALELAIATMFRNERLFFEHATVLALRRYHPESGFSDQPPQSAFGWINITFRT
jgi:hypothetical protein